MLSRLYIFLALTLSSYRVFSQKVIINGKEGDRALTWNDFKGRPDEQSSYGAYTYTFFKTQTGNFTFKGDTVKWEKPIEYWVELGKDSWVKKDKRSDTLLQHEEGHFKIGKLMVLELNVRMKNEIFLKNNYQLKLNGIIKEISDRYRALEKQYDSETNHSKNRPAQWKWNQYFDSELARWKGNQQPAENSR